MNIESENYSAVTYIHKNLKNGELPKKVLIEEKEKEKKQHNQQEQIDLEDHDDESHIDQYV
ncbi:MAG: hypothetical protein OEZ36_12740 [Spirochaetota bacterium]|nr:hypothetical protein [Spirochaetota bacterium]